MISRAMQTALQLLFPPSCLNCGGLVETAQGLCGGCWGDTAFIAGTVCDLCGAPLPGDTEDAVHCDDCLANGRLWDRGRAALVYSGVGRRLVLALKHGDRLDLVDPLANWMARVAGPVLEDAPILLPVPLHTWRLIARRHNQSALLAEALAGRLGLTCLPQALRRPVPTRSLDGLGREARYEMLQGRIVIDPDHAKRIAGRPVCLVDDVMTSGATFAAAAEACHAAGASGVFILALARVVKDA